VHHKRGKTTTSKRETKRKTAERLEVRGKSPSTKNVNDAPLTRGRLILGMGPIQYTVGMPRRRKKRGSDAGLPRLFLGRDRVPSSWGLTQKKNRLREPQTKGSRQKEGLSKHECRAEPRQRGGDGEGASPKKGGAGVSFVHRDCEGPRAGFASVRCYLENRVRAAPIAFFKPKARLQNQPEKPGRNSVQRAACSSTEEEKKGGAIMEDKS